LRLEITLAVNFSAQIGFKIQDSKCSESRISYALVSGAPSAPKKKFLIFLFELVYIDF